MNKHDYLERIITLYDFTILLSQRAHEGQTYDDGKYFDNHILKVVRRAQTINKSIMSVANPPNFLEVCSLAFLHDAIEDNESIDRGFLERCGYPDEFIRQLELLTKFDDETYEVYINYLCLDDSVAAKIVKLADNECNLAAANGIKDEAQRARLVKRWTESREKVYEALCVATDNKLTYKIQEEL